MPLERQRALLDDANASVILTQERLLPSAAEGLDVICLDRDWSEVERQPDGDPGVEVHGDNIAYLAYTSGSTGTPKGVAVPHRAVRRLALDPDYVPVSADDVVLQFASPAFDASTFEIWAPLLNGARLAIYPEAGASLAKLVDTVRTEGVTVLWLTAGLFHRLSERQIEKLTGVRYLLAAWRCRVRRAGGPGTAGVAGPADRQRVRADREHHLHRLPPRHRALRRRSVPIGRPIRGPVSASSTRSCAPYRMGRAESSMPSARAWPAATHGVPRPPVSVSSRTASPTSPAPGCTGPVTWSGGCRTESSSSSAGPTSR